MADEVGDRGVVEVPSPSSPPSWQDHAYLSGGRGCCWRNGEAEAVRVR